MTSLAPFIDDEGYERDSDSCEECGAPLGFHDMSDHYFPNCPEPQKKAS